jgi:hypothetical protein
VNFSDQKHCIYGCFDKFLTESETNKSIKIIFHRKSDYYNKNFDYLKGDIFEAF